MAARHGVREAEVDRLLRDGVFVDLYPIVRRALRVGSRSYSIKKLEPLYMGDEVRTSDVQKGDDSIVEYVAGARARRRRRRRGGARAILDELADYNRYDCVSTRRLRDWLVDRAREAGLRPSPNPEPGERRLRAVARARSRCSRRCARAIPDGLAPTRSRCDSAPPRSTTTRARRRASGATHFLRLREPVAIWAETRDVVVLDSQRCRVVEDWHRAEGSRSGERRMLELRGELAPGTRLSEGSDPFALVRAAGAVPVRAHRRAGSTPTTGCRSLEVLDDGAIVEETAVAGRDVVRAARSP